MTSSTCDRVREDLGAYALGRLEPAQDQWVRDHLAQCPDCEAGYAEIAGVVPLLSTVSIDQLSVPEQVPAGVEETIRRARAERAAARRRRLVALAAAVVLIVGVGVGSWAVTRAQQPDTAAGGGYTQLVADPVSWDAVNETNEVSARVTMNPVAWGTRVDVELEGIKRGSICHLVIVDADGEEWSAGSWRASYGGGLTWSGGVSVPTNRIREIVVYLPDREPLVKLDG